MIPGKGTVWNWKLLIGAVGVGVFLAMTIDGWKELFPPLVVVPDPDPERQPELIEEEAA